MVQEEFLRLSQNGFDHKCSNDSKSEFLPIPVKDFGNPTYLYDKCNEGIDSIFRGLVKSPASKVDGWVRDEFLIEHFSTYLLSELKKRANIIITAINPVIENIPFP